MGLSRRPLVCARVNPFKHKCLETSGRTAIKFYLKQHWSGEKAALAFGQDRIRTQFCIAIDSSHRVIIGKTVSTCFLGCFDRILVTTTYIRARMSSKFGQT